jgi:hypothetical protein
MLHGGLNTNPPPPLLPHDLQVDRLDLKCRNNALGCWLVMHGTDEMWPAQKDDQCPTKRRALWLINGTSFSMSRMLECARQMRGELHRNDLSTDATTVTRRRHLWKRCVLYVIINTCTCTRVYMCVHTHTSPLFLPAFIIYTHAHTQTCSFPSSDSCVFFIRSRLFTAFFPSHYLIDSWLMESKPCRQHHTMDLPLIGDSMSDIFPLWDTCESKRSTELRMLMHRGDYGHMGTECSYQQQELLRCHLLTYEERATLHSRMRAHHGFLNCEPHIPTGGRDRADDVPAFPPYPDPLGRPLPPPPPTPPPFIT